MSTWQTYLDDHQDAFLRDLFDFLRIPSISSLPDHGADVEKAAHWVQHRLKRAGLDAVEVLPTGGHPVVYGEWLGAPGKPTVLIYGHFDTQPVDPEELWTHPPFDPHLEGEGDGRRVVARGASDDKGNMLAPILAVEALLKSEGALPVNVKFLFEGQEEIGSPELGGFLAKSAERLACDLVLSADGGQWREDQPALLLGLRGICAVQIDVTGPSHDLHSGGYGGAVQNPIHALVEILASMRAEDGRIQVEGFYDAVRPLSDEDRDRIAAVPFDEDDYKALIGLDDVALAGEAGYTPYERVWARPTLEINGIWGGFQGSGTKTVLPREAHAKITCRLVPDQEPNEVVERIAAHVDAHTPPGVRATVTPEGSHAHAYLIPAEHPGNAAVAAVHRELYGKEPLFTRSGGSIPFCGLILDTLGVYTVNFAFGLSDERAHSPNEFFRLASFERGQRGYCLLLHELAGRDLQG